MKEKKDEERGEVSRRDFLIGAGAVVVGGAIGAGITYPLVSDDGGDGEVTTTTKVSTVTVPTTVTSTTTLAEGEVLTETVTDTVVSTKTIDVGGGVEPWQEPEETHYFQLTFH